MTQRRGGGERGVHARGAARRSAAHAQKGPGSPGHVPADAGTLIRASRGAAHSSMAAPPLAPHARAPSPPWHPAGAPAAVMAQPSASDSVRCSIPPHGRAALGSKVRVLWCGVKEQRVGGWAIPPAPQCVSLLLIAPEGRPAGSRALHTRAQKGRPTPGRGRTLRAGKSARTRSSRSRPVCAASSTASPPLPTHTHTHAHLAWAACRPAA